MSTLNSFFTYLKPKQSFRLFTSNIHSASIALFLLKSLDELLSVSFKFNGVSLLIDGKGDYDL